MGSPGVPSATDLDEIERMPSATDLDEIERAFAASGADLRIERSHLGDPPRIAALLTERAR